MLPVVHPYGEQVHHPCHTAPTRTAGDLLGLTHCLKTTPEYGYGMALAIKKIREKIEQLMTEFVELDIDAELNEVFNEWLEGKDDAKASRVANRQDITKAR